MDDRFDEQLRRRLSALDAAVPAQTLDYRLVGGATARGRRGRVGVAGRLPLGLAAGLVVAIVGVAMLGAAFRGQNGASGASVSPSTLGGMEIADAHALPIPGSGNPVVITATITNHTGQVDKLIGGSSPVAATVGLYATVAGSPYPTGESGMAGLTPFPFWLIGPGETIQLRSGDGEMVLTGLARPISVGDTVEVTFRFESAAPVTVQVPVVGSDLPPGVTPQPSPWWSRSGVSSCGWPAMYLANGTVGWAGDCAANLGSLPNSVKVKVGDTVEVHMLAEVGPTGGIVPIYPTPTSDDAGVLARVSVSDSGTTAGFRAVAPGTARIMTTGECTDSQTLQQTFGACPVLEVTVTN